MAKARGGLGRGLGSLLSNGADGTLPQENEPSAAKEQVENEATEAPIDYKKPNVPKAPVVPIKPSTQAIDENGPDKQLEEKSDEIAVEPEEKTMVKESQEDVYSNKEDNIVIKSVKEREVDPSKQKVYTSRKSSATVKSDKEAREVDIDLIVPNPNQPRTKFKKEELEELAQSIKKNGLLQPILVRKVDDRFEIIAGERRWQACKNIGLQKVPVHIRNTSDEEMVMLALVENIQRSNLNPIEEAYGYRRMMERGKMTQSEVAQAVSKGRSTIANALRLLELPEDAQQLLYEEKITAGHARAILSIPNKEGRRKLTDKLVKDELSVREAEAIARLLSGKKDSSPAERVTIPKSYKTAARTLSETLSTEVKIKSTKGKNKIEIEFKDETDLERLFRIITHSKN